MINIAGETMTVDFSRWDLDAYRVFLQSKRLPEYNISYDWRRDGYELKAPSRFARIFGLPEPDPDRGLLPFHSELFDYQLSIVETALKAKRFAVWADTGLGKTFMELEFAIQVAHRTGGRVLTVAPLNIIPQTLEEAAFWYGYDIELTYLATREDLRRWCVNGPGRLAIVNPDKFIPRSGQPETVSEMQYLAGVVLDESSLLKAGGGVIKWALIKSCRGIEYKLSCTATPAPNDTMEYASQGSFLEKLRNEGEIIWTFFTRDREGNWKVKDHAKDAFYRFMSGWSIYLRNPAAYGFDDNLKDLPKPILLEHQVPITKEQMQEISMTEDAAGQSQLFGHAGKLGVTQRNRYSQIAKGFVYTAPGRARRIASNKPGMVADLVRQDLAAGLQVLVWTVFDEEARTISELMADVEGLEVLEGKTPKKDRAAVIERFRKGKSRVLISKASLLGYGLNFQNCGSMVFSGFNDSFEQFYQAVRRAYRYGQTKPVRVHVPVVQELEGEVWRNVNEKQAKFERDVAICERNYLAARRERLH